MNSAQAISLVVDWIRSHGLDYPTDGLEADRFDVGWSVYVPVDIDETDPMAFLEMPVGRSVFLIGDSGRIEEVSSSIPPQRAIDQFIAKEGAVQRAGDGSAEAEFMAEFERHFRQAASQGPPEFTDFTVVDAPPGAGMESNAPDESALAAEASRLLEPIVQQLALLGPPDWERFSAEFALTISAEVARLRFWSGDRSGLVPVPESIAEMVRQQRHVAAQMPAGPWWRLLLTVTNRGEMTVGYDYGDDPFPEDQLLSPEHYQEDLEFYPRPHVPVWLAGYAAGPGVQGRGPQQSSVAAAADAAAGRTAIATGDIPPLHLVWARWAVLSAAYAGVRSEWGPRIHPGYAWHENDHRSGSTLFVLPGERAVLSGGKWNSVLLEAACNGGEPLPDLYTGAPFWVNDSVLNTRNRNVALTFCFWWENGQWYRGTSDTSGELDAPIPLIWTPERTIQAMAGQTGPGTESRCESLLIAATDHNATVNDVAAIFTNKPGADIAAAANQLSLAGLLAT
jgi:hypothetical protein